MGIYQLSAAGISAWLLGGGVGPVFEGLVGDQRECGADLSGGLVMIGIQANIGLEKLV